MTSQVDVAKQIAILVWFVAPIAFCLAGVIEWRSNSPSMERLLRLIAPIVGLAAFVLSLNPGLLVFVTPQRSLLASRIMVLVCSLVGTSGAVMTYSRRSTAWLIALGALVLQAAWLFNGTIMD